MEGMYSPTRDPKIPAEGKSAAFARWVSGYYAHSPSLLSSFPSVTLDELRKGIAEAPIRDPPPNRVPSVVNMSAEELAEITDPAVITRSHPLYYNVDPALCKENLDAALLDASTCPRLRVSLVWCDMSPPETVMSTWYLARQIQDLWPSNARKIDVVRFEGANHFPHWDEPDRTMNLLAKLI